MFLHKWNPVYLLTICLWLVMCYLAWKLGYNVGQTSVDQGWAYNGRLVQDVSNYDQKPGTNQNKYGIQTMEYFPRPCQHNKTDITRIEVVIFGFVPKCGGRTILSLVFALRLSNHITVKSDLNYSLAVSEMDVQRYINRVSETMTSTVFIYTNVRFIPLASSPERALIQIGLIRDPMQRLVSSFYHTRFGDRLSANTIDEATWLNNLKAKHVQINETFDDCVKNKMPECLGENTKGMLVKQFCGYHSDCKTASHAALLRAKNNVRNNYLVVGLLEEIDDFVQVLEKLRPTIFKGAFDKLENDERVKSIIRYSRTVGVQSVTDLTKGVIKKHLALDYEFYYFIQWRFFKQKETCAL